MCGLAALPTPVPETAADEAAKAATKAARKKATATLCQVERACDEYARERRACAVAGNFDKCMEIRNSELTEALDNFMRDGWLVSCTTDGLSADAKDRVLKRKNLTKWPSPWECLVN